MSTFNEHRTTADRSANDRARHKKKIERAIRDGVIDVVSEESIIGQDGKKRIRIPVKGLREWQFVYGDNEGTKRVGSSPGNDIKRGQVIGRSDGQQQPGAGAGNSAGDEFYEVEVSLEELAEYLFDSLALPDLEKKKFRTVETKSTRRHGLRSKGIPPRLDKRESAIRRIRRMVATKKEDKTDSAETFPFHEDDLRYHHIKQCPKESTSAVIFLMMDVSGSMTTDIKFLARSFYFLVYQFIHRKYDNVKIMFIGHTTEAFETDEDSFFKRGSSGGTHLSSAPELALEIIDEHFHPSSWNIYAFHCSDGDNWENDNAKAAEMYRRLCQISQLVGYVEIKPESEAVKWLKESSMMSIMSNIGKPMKAVLVTKALDIWPAFSKFFGGENE